MVRAAAFSKPVGVSREKVPTFTESGEEFGENVFTGAVAGKYLSKHGLPMNTLEDHSWTRTSADAVAAAVLDWAKDHNASVITHWFQPKGTTGMRHGHTGTVQNAMFVFGEDGKPQWSLDGATLLKGETDALRTLRVACAPHTVLAATQSWIRAPHSSSVGTRSSCHLFSCRSMVIHSTRSCRCFALSRQCPSRQSGC